MKLKQAKAMFYCRLAVYLAAGFLFLAGTALPAAGLSAQASFVVGQKSYTAGGREKSMDAATFIDQNRTFVPLRYLALAIGVPEKNIGWDDASKTVTLTSGDTTLRLTIGNKTLRINNQTKPMDVAPVIKNDRAYLPARYVAEAFGCQVDWDESTRTVSVFLPSVVPDYGLVVVKESKVNVRSGPDINFDIIAQANQGDSLEVMDKSGEWYKVQLPGGKAGWIASWLVTGVSSPDPDLPPASNTLQEPSRGGDRTAPGAGVNQQPESSSGSSQKGQTPAGDQPNDSTNGGATPANALTSLQASRQGDITRITVSAGKAMSYHAFRLSAPDRLVVDLTGVQPGNQPPVLTVDSSTVQNVRVGYYSKNPDVTRLVFDFKQYAGYRIMFSGDQKTLTVEISLPQLSDVLGGAAIAVDPGHGGNDPGAVGPGGLYEKSVNLAVGRRVADLLEKQGAQVILTRNGDYYVGLNQRTAIANQAGANLFISIHMNASPNNQSYNSTSTYYINQNGVDNAVYYLGESRQMEEKRQQESGDLASSIQSEMVKALGLKDDGVRQANFAVLRTSLMPAVLVEVAYISNPQQESRMTTDQFVENTAQSIVRGIAGYLAMRHKKQ